MSINSLPTYPISAMPVAVPQTSLVAQPAVLLSAPFPTQEQNEPQSQLGSKIPELLNTNINLQAEKNSLKAKVLSLKQILSCNRELLSNTCRERNELQNQLGSKTQELLDANKNLHSLNENVQSLRETLSRVKQERDDLRKELESKTRELLEANKNLQVEKNSLNAKVQSLGKTLSRVSQQRDELRSQLESKNKKLKDTELKNAGKNEAIRLLKERLKKKEREVEAAATPINRRKLNCQKAQPTQTENMETEVPPEPSPMLLSDPLIEPQNGSDPKLPIRMDQLETSLDPKIDDFI